MNLITLPQLKTKLILDPQTGACTDLRGNSVGSATGKGYARVALFGREYRVHRLMWLWVYGEHPPEGMTIDHINGVKTDNRIENLRLATVMQNVGYYHDAKRDPARRNITKERNRKGYRIELLYQGKRIRRRAATLENAILIRDALFDAYPPLDKR